uniref:Type VI secretion system tip protein VgrG n=1 Tax=Haemonchus placei TaxID=6290 RepID=A0A0N4X1Z8_HAEPC
LMTVPGPPGVIASIGSGGIAISSGLGTAAIAGLDAALENELDEKELDEAELDTVSDPELGSAANDRVGTGTATGLGTGTGTGTCTTSTS